MKNINEIGVLVQEEKRANQNESFNNMSKVIGAVALEQMKIEHDLEDKSEKWNKFDRRIAFKRIEYADEIKQNLISELADVMRYRRAKQGEDAPFVGKFGDVEFIISPKNPSTASFVGEDRISSATINGEDIFAEYALESNSFLNYDSKDISTKELNLRKTIFVTNDGEISEEYFLSKKSNEQFVREETFWPRGAKYWSDDGKNDEEMGKIVSDFVDKHPGYEIGADKNTFIRSNIEPTEIISNEPLEGFKKDRKFITFGEFSDWNDRSRQERLFRCREGKELDTIKTYGDIMPLVKSFSERCKMVYDIATAAQNQLAETNVDR